MAAPTRNIMGRAGAGLLALSIGKLFHTTESQQAPFEAGENRHLKRIGESALAQVRRNRSYNFLIDRFGRVYR
jgi:hypothetical protein